MEGEQMGLNKCDEQNNLKAENWNDFRAFYMDTFMIFNFTFMADFLAPQHKAQRHST